MILLCDNREQKPLTFDKDYIEMVVPCTLSYGDYRGVSSKGVWSPVVFERKNKSDLFGTLGKGYSRFKREINRSIEDGSKLVLIVECSLSSILKGYKYSKMKPEGIMRTMFTLMTKHGIPFVCCSSREEMVTYISEFYRSYFLNLEGV